MAAKVGAAQSVSDTYVVPNFVYWAGCVPDFAQGALRQCHSG